MPQVTQSYKKTAPMVPISMISHGTLSCKDIGVTRRFLEEVLGFEVVQWSPLAMVVRLGTDHTYVVVETGQPGTMGLMDHNGLDVSSPEAVEEANRTLREIKDEWGLRRVNKVGYQHGAYSFYFQDMDDNWWEIIYSDRRGYSWVFDDPGRDITGRRDIDIDEMGHTLDEEYYERLQASD